MTITFEDFWKSIIADEIWYNQISFMYNKKNRKQVAQECYAWLLTQPERLAANDVGDFRRAYQSWLKNAKDDYQAPQLQQVEKEPEKKSDPPLTGEARMAWLKKWEAKVKASKMMSGVTRMSLKQIAEEGGWRPQKDKPWPKTSENAIRERVFHAAYIESNYDPITGNKLLTWKDEETWTHDHEFELMEIWNEKKKELFNP